jgi:hypothetical protein
VTKGERLAADLKEANRAFVELVRGLTDEQWRARAANAPGYRYDDPGDELRSAGQVALHTAHQHLIQAEITRAVAKGETPAVAAKPSPVANAEEAGANPEPDRAEVIRLLEANGDAAAEMLRGLTDDELARGMTFRGWTMTAEQLAEQGQIGHVRWHTASIAEALGREAAG